MTPNDPTTMNLLATMDKIDTDTTEPEDGIEGIFPGASTPVPPRTPFQWKQPGVYLAAVLAAIVLAFGVVGVVKLATHHDQTAASVVSGDGYTVGQSFTPGQVEAAMAAQGGSASTFSTLFTDAAMGTKGDNSEIAIGLTSKGETVISTILPYMQGNGVTAHVNGNYLVLDGTSNALNNF